MLAPRARTGLLPVLLPVLLCLLLAGCALVSGRDTGAVVDGGTARMALDADPASLDPLAAAPTRARDQLTALAYEHLLDRAPDGGPAPALASSWRVTPAAVSFVLRPGATCADGTPLTATVAAASFAWVLDPAHRSPWLGTDVVPGSLVTADDTARTLTITSPVRSPFALADLGRVPVVCGAGGAGRSGAPVGSGPYRLVSAVAGQRYTYLLRTTPTPGLPRRVVVTVVPGAQRRADLLLAGHLDLTTLDGAQRDRVDAAGLDDASAPTGTVLLVFDEAGGRPAADPGVRRSLVQALDLGALATAAAGGHGTPLRSLEPVVPPLCRQDTVGASPSFDVEKAAAGLQAAGWRLGPDGKRSRAGVPLVLHLVHPRDGGAGLVTAAGLLAQEWSALGARVVGTTSDAPAGTLPAGTGWDAVLAPFAVPDPAAWPAVLGSAVDDGAYTAAVRRAVDAATPSCTDWTTAERALVSGADVVPVTATTTGAYGLHATYRLDEDGLVDPAGVVLTR